MGSWKAFFNECRLILTHQGTRWSKQVKVRLLQLRSLKPIVTQEKQMFNLVQKFIKDESGATSIEYGLIAAGIGVALVTIVNGVGSEIKALFEGLTSDLNTFNNPPA
jgi:pilus assembly protein Flp/PilA